jgi:hypothetical protein
MSVATYIRLTIIERERIRAGEIAVRLDLLGITFPTFALLIHKVDYFGASASVDE